METKRINKGNTLMIAHRGLSGIERENTIAAFVAAANRSYFGIETDVYRTKDGQYVLFHDGSTGRIALDNVPITESTYNLLKSIELTDTDGRTRSDLHIALLSEYVRICKRYGKKCILEIKGQFEKEHIKDVVDIIKGEDYTDGVIFISFHICNLINVREYLPDQPAQLLTGEINDNMLKMLTENKLDIDVIHTTVTEENIKLLHDHGIKVNVWTVDDKEKGEQYALWGADYITTNILE